MNKEYAIQLTRIYNTLMGVNTRGEDTLIMAECLKALAQVINEMSTADVKEGVAKEE